MPNKLFVASTTRNKMPPEKGLGVRKDSLKFSFHSLLLPIMLSHQAFVSGLIQNHPYFRSCHRHFGQSVDDVNIVCFAFLVSEEYSIETAWTCDRMPISATTTLDSFGLLDPPFQFYRKLKISGACEKISGFVENAFTRKNRDPDSKVFGFKVPTLDSGFKISRDMTKSGCFYFGFVLLCVNGKTNPVLKRSGFVTNPEQFPLV